MNNFDNDITPQAESSTSLDILDAEPVLEVVSESVFGFKKRFLFFNTHFEYKIFFGKKRKVCYSLIEKIYCAKNKIKIKLYRKMFAITLSPARGIENIEDNFVKLRKLTGF